MKGKLGDVLLPERPVRWLGVFLLAAGLVLLLAVVALRAASWRPPTETAGEEAPELRPELVILHGGTFLMGSPEDEEGRDDDDETLHEVTLTRSFAISRTEVTQGQYFEVMRGRPMEARTDAFGKRCAEAGLGDELPVVCVSWREAVEYCNELSRREGVEPAYDVEGESVTWNRGSPGYRLPTEAEWEFAARAGTRHPWVGAATVEGVCNYANVADASAKRQNPEWATFGCDDSFPALAPVAALAANRWQLYGLGGNAAEWVWDTYGPYPEGPDPIADDEGAPARVFRGGAWRSGPRFARVAYRGWVEPSGRYALVGFRVARSLPSAI